ncbi:hypothetical protein LK994_05610 [Ferruginibacter lapsinanis]|uniref:hypothetical protein n=1 Tax=Ferruginibacter lapsinanis TaxID=563172 RepID=UPI001E46AA3B|nr:hypothetical protein [Ferruginibacter lapsinanis]UEG50949.1 hypothetical protein LK994_05610 [Ferruginibacter lapsinanis]
MKWLLFFVPCLFQGIVVAQNKEEIKVISTDSLKKYKIGVSKDSTKIYYVKKGAVYSDKMSAWEKVGFFADMLYEKYTILSWGLMILAGLWLLNGIGKCWSWLKDRV